MSSQQHIIRDEEIQERVDSLAGKGAKIIDCEKKSSVMTEEILLLNGVQVKLVGEAGERIKEALKSGQSPPPELLSEILIKAGIENNPVELETTMKVKSNTKTTELSTLRDKNGLLVDEKMKEVEEDDEYQTSSIEVWEKDPDTNKTKYLDGYISMEDSTDLQNSPISQNSDYNTPLNIPHQVRYTESSPLRNLDNNVVTQKRFEYPKLIREPTKHKNMQLLNASSYTSPLNEMPYRNSASRSNRQENFQMPVRVVYETFI